MIAWCSAVVAGASFSRAEAAEKSKFLKAFPPDVVLAAIAMPHSPVSRTSELNNYFPWGWQDFTQK